MRVGLPLALLQLLGAVAQYQWELIDTAAVVCPPIAPIPGAPLVPNGTAGTFSVNLTLDSLQQSMPYIFTFIRATSAQLNISYQVTDATGAQVVPPTQVSLAAIAAPTVPAGCACVSTPLPAIVASTYGSNYGSQCSAWENTNCALWWGNTSVGDWCCKPWCFASSSCPDAFPSDVVPGAYISYSACLSTPPVSPCTWTAVAQQNDPCACLNMDKNISQMSPAQLLVVGAGYGSTCSAWDSRTCNRDNDPWTLGSWCCESWCYVSPACPSANYSFARSMNGSLPWSSATCTSDPVQVANCSMMTPDISCQCLNVTMPAGQLPANAASDFGQTCKVHNSNRCQQGANLGIWCCLPWCWVSSVCPYKYNSSEWPGNYLSAYSCSVDPKSLANCSYSNLCQCQSPAAFAGQPALPSGVPSNYGSSCSNWDASTCSATWGNTAVWNPPLDWCCDVWCFVSPACPLSFGPRNPLLGNRSYSTSACADPANLTYQLSTNSCVPMPLTTSRRLHSGSASSLATLQSQQRLIPPRQYAADDDDLLEVSARSRVLAVSSRRSSISPRRRAPSSPRRRAPTSPRRRAAVVSTPRRRASSFSSPRRRVPISTGSVASDLRRRTTALGSRGTVFTTDRRRSSTYVATGTPVSYGYTNKGQVLRNYGSVPYQTSYGYSGYAAYPATYRPNVGLYAGAGLAAGLAVGYIAGSYYSYYNNYGSGSLYYRRRRTGIYELCVVPSGWQRGSLMECWDCSLRYGPCLRANSCYSNAGCGLQLATPMNRDDLATTGFVPSEWVSPLTLTVTGITGLNMTGLCPPTTPAAINASIAANQSFVVRPDLFVTLTQQDVLTAAGSCDSVLGTACTTSCYGSNQVCVPNSAGMGTCVCQDGFCVSGSGLAATCIGTGSASMASEIRLGAVCLLLVLTASWIRR